MWLNARKKKPALGQEVLIFRQGYGIAGNYWSSYELAVYMLNPYDRRRRAFVQSLYPWLHKGVTHWMPLPAPPEKVKNEGSSIR